jgi:hypothetical protein
MSKAKAISQQRNRERQKRCWRTLKILRKGTQSSGGLTHVLINEKNNPSKVTQVQHKSDLDHTLLQLNISHFSQAEGTPFPTDALKSIIGEDGCSNGAIQRLSGNLPPNFPNYYSQNFRRNKQHTSTSGKHLWIYKSLINARKYNLQTDRYKIQQATYANNKQPPIAMCLLIKFYLMTLAVTHCHTYDLWKIVHNFLLEKIPGKPLIDNLRSIQIYEADWSLIQN